MRDNRKQKNPATKTTMPPGWGDNGPWGPHQPPPAHSHRDHSEYYHPGNGRVQSYDASGYAGIDLPPPPDGGPPPQFGAYGRDNAGREGGMMAHGGTHVPQSMWPGAMPPADPGAQLRAMAPAGAFRAESSDLGRGMSHSGPEPGFNTDRHEVDDGRWRGRNSDGPGGGFSGGGRDHHSSMGRDGLMGPQHLENDGRRRLGPLGPHMPPLPLSSAPLPQPNHVAQSARRAPSPPLPPPPPVQTAPPPPPPTHHSQPQHQPGGALGGGAQKLDLRTLWTGGVGTSGDSGSGAVDALALELEELGRIDAQLRRLLQRVHDAAPGAGGGGGGNICGSGGSGDGAVAGGGGGGGDSRACWAAAAELAHFSEVLRRPLQPVPRGQSSSSYRRLQPHQAPAAGAAAASAHAGTPGRPGLSGSRSRADSSDLDRDGVGSRGGSFDGEDGGGSGGGCGGGSGGGSGSGGVERGAVAASVGAQLRERAAGVEGAGRRLATLLKEARREALHLGAILKEVKGAARSRGGEAVVHHRFALCVCAEQTHRNATSVGSCRLVVAYLAPRIILLSL